MFVNSGIASRKAGYVEHFRFRIANRLFGELNRRWLLLNRRELLLNTSSKIRRCIDECVQGFASGCGRNQSKENDLPKHNVAAVLLILAWLCR